MATRKPRPDKAGSKQLSATFRTFELKLAFTGIAVAYGRRTIEELAAELKALPPESSAQEVSAAILRRCRSFAKGKGALLEVVMTIATESDPFRIVIISNFPGVNELQVAKRDFSIRVHPIVRPLYFVSGYSPAVDRFQRRRLASLAKQTDLQPSQILARLREINAIAARNSKGYVSEECWTTSQTIDAGAIRTSGINAGNIPSFVPTLLQGFDLNAFIKDNFRAAPGKELTLVQSASVKVSGPSQAPPAQPIGDPRTFVISSSSATVLLQSPANDSSAQLAINAGDLSVPVRLNGEVGGGLATATATAVTIPGTPTRIPLFPWPQIRIDLKIDGVSVPGGWQISTGYHIEDTTHRLTVSQTSRGIRNIPCLAPDEELVFVAPASNVEFLLRGYGESQTKTLEARLIWRKRLDGTLG